MPHARKDEVTWLPGCYYHLYNRGARRLTIFREERNYLFVLRRIKTYCASLGLTMIAYCLLPNHYHFLVRQDQQQTAGLLPQRVFNSYTKAHNKLYAHSGTLFEGRFKAILVDTDPYLHYLCQYIHANPVKHGMVAQVEAWPFSNYLDWIGERPGSLLDRAWIEAHFGGPTRYRATLHDFVRSQGYLTHEFHALDEA
jgi:putative transposase